MELKHALAVSKAEEKEALAQKPVKKVEPKEKK
jgi:hypothetical protein